MADRLFPPGYQVFDGNGDPLAGAQLFFYESGTSTAADTYSDVDGASANTNPVVADADGRFGPIFGDAIDYKVILKTSGGVTVYTADPVTAVGATAEATQAEVDARTSTSKFVSPAKIADGIGLQGSSIASAAALNLPDVGDYFTCTGSTGITSIEERAAGRRITLRFAGELTLTYNATSLILPGNVDLKTTAGMILELVSEGSGNWRAVNTPEESGTWTPTLIGATTAGTQTYSTQAGRYIRRGNLVTAWFNASISAKGGTISGNVLVGGLPFTSSNISGITPAVVVALYSGIDFTAGYTQLGGYVQPNATTILLQQSGDNVTTANIAATALGAPAQVGGSVTYRIG